MNLRTNQIAEEEGSKSLADVQRQSALSQSLLLQIQRSVSDYYGNKIATHGPVSAGADWRDLHSQQLRFAQLLKISEGFPSFSLLDYGCGYGALLSYLQENDFSERCNSYIGLDWSRSMVEAAKQLHSDHSSNFHCGDRSMQMRQANFTVGSGIFHVKLETTDEDWQNYVLNVMHEIDSLSEWGFAFNLLTKYSDTDKMRSDLFYADPAFFFDYCKRTFARNVALLHDYGLYEFTILVKKKLPAEVL